MASAPHALAGKHLLVVEDDWLLQNLLSTKLAPLAHEGVVIQPVFDGNSAMEAARKDRPDMILLDILLPGMTGFEFLEAMHKEDPAFRTVPVIVFSNLDAEKDRARAKELGVAGFMNKSATTMEEIVEKVSSVLAG